MHLELRALLHKVIVLLLHEVEAGHEMLAGVLFIRGGILWEEWGHGMVGRVKQGEEANLETNAKSMAPSPHNITDKSATKLPRRSW